MQQYAPLPERVHQSFLPALNGRNLAVNGHIKNPDPEPHLRMCQVVAFVVVQRQAQPTLDLPQVVADVVRIFRKVDRLERQPSQPLSPVDRLQEQEKQ